MRRVKVRRWPEQAVLQLWRKGMVRDTFVCDIPFNVPGVGIGAAHKDPFPVQYNWSSLDRFTPPWPLPGARSALTQATGNFYTWRFVSQAHELLLRDRSPYPVPAAVPGVGCPERVALCIPHNSPLVGPDESLTELFRDPNLFGSGSLWVRCAWIADDEENPAMVVRSQLGARSCIVTPVIAC